MYYAHHGRCYLVLCVILNAVNSYLVSDVSVFFDIRKKRSPDPARMSWQTPSGANG